MEPIRISVILSKPSKERRGGGSGIPRRPEFAADEGRVADDVQGNHDDHLFDGIDHRFGDEGIPIGETDLVALLEVYGSRHLTARPYRSTYPRVSVHEHHEGQQELHHAVPARQQIMSRHHDARALIERLKRA